ncbi:hypothetical protein [Geomonas subterranea]|uniref:hypothetical protein n=1 Tax=Geomonas subterranea TaxID=2847989 RepID=UPI001CD50482|nr:hypothetical protein [Geomonas fuzhouensis]
MAEKSIKSRPVDVAKITETLKAQGRQVVYLNTALYPVLQMQVRLREKCRDGSIGDLEVAVLRLAAAGVATVEQFAFSLGVSPQRIQPVLSEMAARGLLEEQRGDQGCFRPTTLGQLSLQHGCEVVETDRAVLLCGITGRLLPRGFYSMTAVSIQDIRAARFIPDMIQEASAVSLAGLDLAKIPNRRAVNLPDEALEIRGVLPESVEPRFIPCHMVVHQGDSAATELHVSGGVVDWLDVQNALGMLEPLGYPDQSVDGALGLVRESLVGLGAHVSQLTVDRFGNPVAEIGGNAEGIIAKSVPGRSLAFSIGTASHQPLPVGVWNHTFKEGDRTRTVDVLRGRTMTIKAQPGSEVARTVDCLRSLDANSRDHRVRLNKGELSLKTSLLEYLTDKLLQDGYTVEQAVTTAQLARDSRLVQALQAPETWK